jgi:uncharacterized protein YggE
MWPTRSAGVRPAPSPRRAAGTPRRLTMTAPVARLHQANVPLWIAWAALAGLAVGIVLWLILGTLGVPGGTTDEDPLTPHTVTVTGLGRVFVAPDVAEVRLGVVIRRATVAEARKEGADATNAVVAALREVGVPETDIQTSMLTLQPVYEYGPNGSAPRIVAYEIRDGLSITVRDLDRVGPAIDGAIEAGATTIDSIDLEIADPISAERTAREEAVRDARGKADALVGAAGARIDDVVSIAESVSTPPWPWRGEAAADDKGTPIMPGVSEVVVTVTIVYGIS